MQFLLQRKKFSKQFSLLTESHDLIFIYLHRYVYCPIPLRTQLYCQRISGSFIELSVSFQIIIFYFIYFWLGWVLMLAWAFSSYSEWKLLFVGVQASRRCFSCSGAQAQGMWASVVAECEFNCCDMWGFSSCVDAGLVFVRCRLSSCSSQALEVLSSCDACGLRCLQHVESFRTRIQPYIPALAGGLLSTAALAESLLLNFN